MALDIIRNAQKIIKLVKQKHSQTHRNECGKQTMVKIRFLACPKLGCLWKHSCSKSLHRKPFLLKQLIKTLSRYISSVFFKRYFKCSMEIVIMTMNAIKSTLLIYKDKSITQTSGRI